MSLNPWAQHKTTDEKRQQPERQRNLPQQSRTPLTFIFLLPFCFSSLLFLLHCGILISNYRSLLPLWPLSKLNPLPTQLLFTFPPWLIFLFCIVSFVILSEWSDPLKCFCLSYLVIFFFLLFFSVSAEVQICRCVGGCKKKCIKGYGLKGVKICAYFVSLTGFNNKFLKKLKENHQHTSWGACE